MTKTSTLTFASDKDLANFNNGDTVNQDSGHTLQTSAITIIDTVSPTSGSKWILGRNGYD